MTVMQSERFRRSAREASLLYYIAERTLRAEEITAKTIAADVFGLEFHAYLSSGNPIVRVTLNHLRKALEEYFNDIVGEGATDAIVVTIATIDNTYRAEFTYRNDRTRFENGYQGDFPIHNGFLHTPFYKERPPITSVLSCFAFHSFAPWLEQPLSVALYDNTSFRIYPLSFFQFMKARLLENPLRVAATLTGLK